MQKGNIGVTTENIFPVIKKFLYSDHEIFLREMVSNAVDATQKMKTLAERGDFIVSPEGKVVAYEVISSNVGRNAEELLRRVQASQFVYEHGDQVCPANWTPGEETIEPSLDLVGQL